MPDAAAGIQQAGALVGDQDLQVAARAQVGLDLAGEVVDVDHDPLDPSLNQLVQHPVDQRPPSHRDQRLGGRVGQRPHAGAEPGRQHHRGSGPFFAVRGRHALASAGTCRSNQRLSPAIAGSVRSRSR